jgi:hypothetical protein
MQINYPNPGQKKPENLKYGRDIVVAFCKVNKVKIPKIVPTYARGYYGLYVWGSGKLSVNEIKAKPPVTTPGFSWSYTGYKSDLTGAGIIAHECGHYIDEILKFPSKRIKKAVRGEKAVSSYEPDRYEVFAESMKLFILNPNLLKVGRPKRYAFLCELGLIPLINDDWETVLAKAHPKLIAAARNWIKAGQAK